METLSALLAFCEGNQEGEKYGALVFTLLLAWTSCGKNSRGAGGLRRHDAHVSSCVAKPLPVLVWLCNIDSCLSFINKGFNYMHHFSVEELCKMRIYIFLISPKTFNTSILWAIFHTYHKADHSFKWASDWLFQLTLELLWLVNVIYEGWIRHQCKDRVLENTSPWYFCHRRKCNERLRK